LTASLLTILLNLDTHILLRAVNLTLSRLERRLLDEQSWCISAMVLWEIEMLARSGRIRIDLRTPEMLEVLDQVQIVPIDINVAHCIRLLDFRSDPADELIAATSIQLNIPLVTRDENILRSKVVPLIRF
jgi:PIN domain nuclease of toxin-antitoxin system